MSKSLTRQNIEIAAKAGVSLGTVQRYFRGVKTMEANRIAIETACTKLGISHRNDPARLIQGVHSTAVRS